MSTSLMLIVLLLISTLDFARTCWMTDFVLPFVRVLVNLESMSVWVLCLQGHVGFSLSQKSFSFVGLDLRILIDVCRLFEIVIWSWDASSWESVQIVWPLLSCLWLALNLLGRLRIMLCYWLKRRIVSKILQWLDLHRFLVWCRLHFLWIYRRRWSTYWNFLF